MLLFLAYIRTDITCRLIKILRFASMITIVFRATGHAVMFRLNMLASISCATIHRNNIGLYCGDMIIISARGQYKMYVAQPVYRQALPGKLDNFSK